MSSPTTILQPTAKELMNFIQLATQDKSVAVEFIIKVNPLTDEMSTEEVCAVLNASMRTVTTLVSKKILNPIKRSNKNIYSRKELNAAIEAGRI
jgi:hypothetical protein